MQAALKQVQLLTHEELLQIANLIVKGRADDLEAIASSSDATALERMICSVVNVIIATGDMRSLNMLLDRMLGKIPDHLKLGLDAAGPVQINLTMPSNGREVILP